MADQPAIDPALLALRERIDAVDRELLALLNQRASWRWRSARSRSARARWSSGPSARRRSSTA
jgi:chorismate mutase